MLKLGALVLAVATLAAVAWGQSAPRCFGAASRDAAHPCHNAALDRSVAPTPARARRLPNARCEPVRVEVPFVCAFGAPAEAARTVALIGDSHAVHWRAALGPVAEAEGWHGVSLTRAGCPLSAARPILPQRLLPDCLRWRRAVPAWLGEHPEVDTVFVSEHRVRALGGLEAQVRGYLRAWRALPSTVRRIVVIRDTPSRPQATRACVLSAIARKLRAGRACAMPRSLTLHADPAATAARRTRSRRIALVDLTRFFCGPRSCYPVIGGALVHKDNTHLTAVFGATLAPYLRQRLNALGL